MSYDDSTKYKHEDPLLYLDFHHHIILVRCNEESVLEKLRDEFHFFIAHAHSNPHTEIDLKLEPIPELPSMVAVKILENASIYHLGSRQYVDYFGEALAVIDSGDKKIQVYSLNADRLFELGFLAIYSDMGEALDQDGLCRLHALAVSIGNVNAITMLPSKGGKSTLLKNLLENPEVKIISDDMPLCDHQGRIHPFPSKISLGEIPTEGVLATLTWHEFKRHHYPAKWTASLAQLRDRLEKTPQDHKNLLIAGHRLSSGHSILSEVPRWKMIMPLLEHMIMGFGLPQILEMFLKFNFTDFIKLPYHAVVRSVCAFKLLRNSKCFYFYLGPDKAYNAQLLLDLMYEYQG